MSLDANATYLECECSICAHAPGTELHMFYEEYNRLAIIRKRELTWKIILRTHYTDDLKVLGRTEHLLLVDLSPVPVEIPTERYILLMENCRG